MRHRQGRSPSCSSPPCSSRSPAAAAQPPSPPPPWRAPQPSAASRCWSPARDTLLQPQASVPPAACGGGGRGARARGVGGGGVACGACRRTAPARSSMVAVALSALQSAIALSVAVGTASGTLTSQGSPIKVAALILPIPSVRPYDPLRRVESVPNRKLGISISIWNAVWLYAS